jgi:ABC-type molybdate transport system substrate-binding protein
MDSSDLNDVLSLPIDPASPRAVDALLYTGESVNSLLLEKDAIDAQSARTFAGDKLVLVCRPELGYQSATLFDVYRLRFKSFGVCDPAVNALGIYSEQALVSDGLKPRIEDRLQVLATPDELIAGLQNQSLDVVVLYASTAASTPGLKSFMAVGEDLHEDIQWKLAAAKGRSADPAVQKLLVFLSENEAVQAKYEAFGLVPRKLALVEEK